MSNLYQMEELGGMKRSELQKLAKQNGIKANMKTDGLIKALAAVVDSNMVGSHPVLSEQEATTTSASSTEDQSEVEISEEKAKSRRGRGRKQKNVKNANVKDSPLKETADMVASGDNVDVTSCLESESQTSSATEDEKVSPVGKKSKAKRKGRGQGRRGRQTKEKPIEEQTQQTVTPVVSSPAVTGRRSRSVTRTPIASEPTLPTPPNSGSSRNIRRAIRRTTHTPEPRPPTPAQPTPSTQTPNAAPSINKRSSKGASKAPLTATPKTTPAASKTPVGAKTRGSTGKRSASGSAGGKAKKVRRGTFDKTPEKTVPPPKSNNALKDEIMAEIDRKVQMHVAQSKSSSIPTRVPGAKKTPSKKNWSKTHHGALDKMESIDAYLERKQKRAEALSATKKPKIPVIAKPVLKAKGFNFASPKPSTTKSQTFNFASPKPTKASMPTNPKSAKTVSFKVSKLKTPKKVTLPSMAAAAAPAIDKRRATPGARKSVSVLTPGSGSRKSVGGVTPGNERKSIGSTRTPSRKSVGGLRAGNERKSLGAAKTPSRKSVGGAVTPFGKTATTTPAAKPKNAFDIKASLSKPLGYKPHTGKLKPFGENLQNDANVRAPSSNLAKAKTMIKKPQLKGRDNRRAGNKKHRTQMRNDSFMANRGIPGC